MMKGFCGLLVEEGKFSGGVIVTGVLWVAGVVYVLWRSDVYICIERGS